MKKGTFAIGAVLLVCSLVSCSSPWDIPTSELSRPVKPSLVLLTLDTTRSDYVGAYGTRDGGTPILDSLADRGTRYARALTASPLTLPAHASLLTGLDPPAHGLLDNGTATLHPSVPTLATILSSRGYSCAAFVSSRVLDRRFGLNPGFGLYDDFMAAEQLGEYGYPERDAGSVTASAISWLSALSPSQPYFLWVHYYDPHAPYEPPAQWQGSTTTANYAGEIAYVDQEIGRLLSALPGEDQEAVIAVVGDHGESLGEHGEKTHGIFLYRASLEVPLILAGPGVPTGEVVEEVVATRRLMATLLRLLGVGDTAQDPGSSLPGLPAVGDPAPPEPVYSATWMPANTYGWSPLRAVSDQRWRLILAPRPELYDFQADPGELDNLINAHPQESERLGRVLAAIEEDRKAYATGESPAGPELLAALRSLGYFSGSVPPDPDVGAIDPKDGLPMLAESDRARQLLQSLNYDESLVILRGLAERLPGSVVAWIGAEMEFALSQAVASGDTFEHRPSECGHCVQDFLADLDLRDLPGEAAGSESGADDALPPADLRFYPAALVVPCGRLPGHAAVAADLGNMAIPNGWIPRRLRSDHCVLWRRYNHIQGLPIPFPQQIPCGRSIIGAVRQKARDRGIELIQEPG